MKNFYDCCNNFPNMTYNQKICYICDYEYEYFLNKTNIVGIGLGYKVKNKVPTLNTCLKVFASEKVPENELPETDLVPPIYKGIKTDVIQTGTFNSLDLFDKTRPVPCGYCIGPATQRSFGTLGCLVTDGQFIYILSNNHVIGGFNSFPIGTSIIQPSLLQGAIPVKDEIATLSKYIPVKFINGNLKPPNYIDCAIAKVTDNNYVSSEVEYIGKPKGIRGHRLGQLVKKVGAVSELTTGIIDEINATITVEINKKELLFKKQIITTGMAKPGDSGSILFNDNDYAVGLLMAGNDDWSIFNSIKRVLNGLNVSIITK